MTWIITEIQTHVMAIIYFYRLYFLAIIVNARQALLINLHYASYGNTDGYLSFRRKLFRIIGNTNTYVSYI